MGAHDRILLLIAVVGAVLTVALDFRPVMAAVTRADDTILGWISDLRTPALTAAADRVQALGSFWTIRICAWLTLAALIGVRRLRHLAVYLAVFLGCSLLGTAVARSLGRMRPGNVTILAGWSGYAYPSAPVVALGLVLVGAIHTLVPAGRWRSRAAYVAAGLMVALILSRLYLGVDHPTDALAGVILGSVVPAAVFLAAAPEEAFPVAYRRGQRAHLDIGGARGAAITQALNHQLGLSVAALEPFGLAGSAGSTPMRIRLTPTPVRTETQVFAKLYALNHLRSDRWYKLARTVLYGRLEDEKPFSTVRRLAEYEDHMLRLLRDHGLPTPRPYGFVEITPEREYAIVMEYFDGTAELGSTLADETVSSGLAIVRKLWDAGVAHRDIKPSNLLIRDGQVLLIDVAFATVRPTPWRQAVDLANMMLTLSLYSTPRRVFDQARRYFTADEIAEALAASRSITIPSQLRSLLQADGRDLLRQLTRMAPERAPVAIQLWDLRRLYVTVAVLAGLAAAVAATAAYLQTTSLL
ncbi:MAG TPA: RIO1 family regulatory kinase/ATPase [Acidimicrobiales bacterium]|nr:RIO1 family regulatory kinase/ATPase [Acidimicrobiales bacterium]